ncbi:DUF6345 domain-containing protein [Pseudosporangium ferrugineum]|uniref:Uncharacterized protein n=1 Tax=Pseudosporangium ferrugineum TaxID=439699 RepID=A0A2T0RDT6_9ACTN|nr:DUF6345 domain-containing protein [Pseudosporangium ferrugineum]PRY19322.1 hypothetical protein CLV70_13526 [Pseudosporangium ferrugineum]
MAVALAVPLGVSVIAAPAQAAGRATLPVFGVRSAGLSEAQTAGLARALGLKQIARGEDGSVRYAAEKSFLSVPTRVTGEGKDEDGQPTTTTVLDVAALKRLRTISEADALRRSAKALGAAKLLPRGAKASARKTTVTAVDRRGRTTVSAALDTAVSYAFTLAGLPYEGPGAKIRVAFDGKGAATSLSFSTRTLAQAGSVEVLTAAEARARCAKAMGPAVRVASATPIYWAPALSTGAQTIEPSFRCAGVDVAGAQAQRVVVPAAVDAPLAAAPEPQEPRGTAGPAAGASKSTQSGPASRAYGRADVGSEGTGVCSGLPYTSNNLNSFNNQFTSRGIPVEFSWRDHNAWEQDFKDPAFGGDDSNWADHVDMTYWQGHGSPTGFSFAGCSSNDDTFLANTEARWGNGDVEWMSLFTCLILAQESGGKRWWQRWGPAFAGLHQINSFHTVSYHSASHGGTYANYMLRSPFLWWNNPMPVRSAWAQASIDDQPASVVWASMGPIGPGGSVNMNDYFWGKGPVGPDVPAASVTGYWYISGAS